MKMPLCDHCLSEGKTTISGWRKKIAHGGVTIRLDICLAHKGMQMANDVLFAIADRAVSMGNRMIVSDQKPKEALS